jgi:hypothetical protein
MQTAGTSATHCASAPLDVVGTTHVATVAGANIVACSAGSQVNAVMPAGPRRITPVQVAAQAPVVASRDSIDDLIDFLFDEYFLALQPLLQYK